MDFTEGFEYLLKNCFEISIFIAWSSSKKMLLEKGGRGTFEKRVLFLVV